METLYHFIRDNTAGLYVTVYTSRFFFLDYWSFVHFFTGVLIIAIALRLRLGVGRRWAAAMGLLLGYEILELAFAYLAIGVFLPETLPDQVTDLVVGALGGLAAEAVATRTARSGAGSGEDAAALETCTEIVPAGRGGGR